MKDNKFGQLFENATSSVAPHCGAVYVHFNDLKLSKENALRIDILRGNDVEFKYPQLCLGNDHLDYKVKPLLRYVNKFDDEIYRLLSSNFGCCKEEAGIFKFHEDNRYDICYAEGSKHNHQNWRGGYYDHVLMTMQIASKLVDQYYYTTDMRWVSRGNFLKVLYFHDIEKIHKYGFFKDKTAYLNTWGTQEKLNMYRVALKERYNIVFTPDEMNALEYIHGEGEDYSPYNRTMTPLAAICHAADILSARVFFNESEVNGY